MRAPAWGPLGLASSYGADEALFCVAMTGGTGTDAALFWCPTPGWWRAPKHILEQAGVPMRVHRLVMMLRAPPTGTALINVWS